jgi:5-methylcytosine-specific restriction endonuclease McrA
MIERKKSEMIRDREPIPDKVRMFVWQRDKGCCIKCGSQEKLEFDHIIPISQGGSNTARNIQILCEKCNRSKGANIY